MRWPLSVRELMATGLPVQSGLRERSVSAVNDRDMECLPAGFCIPRCWCGRGDSNPHGQSPTNFHTRYGFRRRPKAFGVWTIPSPYSGKAEVRCCPSSLYTFPLPGLARDSQSERVPRI